MLPYLHVDYSQLQYWAHPLRTALYNKPSLHQQDQQWRSSILSDLAFSITTRVGAMQELIRLVDASLNTLGEELDRTPNLEELVAGGYAYSFADASAVRQVLITLPMFAAEGKSLFENLVEFYRRFLDHYFGDTIDKTNAEARVLGFSTPTTWRADLNRVRNFTRHRFAPWLAFEDLGKQTRPRWEPLLIHDWRPERLSSTTSTSLVAIRDIKAGLSQSAQGVFHDLVTRINSAP